MTGHSLAALYRVCRDRFAPIEPIEQVLNQPLWDTLAEEAMGAEISGGSLYRSRESLIAWLRSHLGHRDEPVRLECVRCLGIVGQDSDSALPAVIEAYVGALRDPSLEQYVLEEIDRLALLGKTETIAHCLARYLWHLDKTRLSQARGLLERLGDPAKEVVLNQALGRALPLAKGLAEIAEVVTMFGMKGDAFASSLVAHSRDPMTAVAAASSSTPG